MGLDALHGSPRLDQGIADREVFVWQQQLDLRIRQGRGRDLAQHVGGLEPVAVLAKNRGDPRCVVDAQPGEPTK